MTLDAFQNWLNNYLNFEKTQTKNIFWLESMKFLCEKLGNPQDSIPCIHVAGSKGKGSCSSMIANIIQEAGFKCGIYSSPHITDFRERITSPAEFFEDKVYQQSADELTALVDSIPLEQLPAQRPLTWFELVTVYAFLCYKNAGCDYVVYEVGLGGRLDSTNVVKPLASVLMPIELEHTEFLGNTITKIAGEKAGIIKENIPAITAPQNYSAADKVFKAQCKSKNSQYITVKNNLKKLDFSYMNNGFMKLKFKLSNENYETNLRLLGKVQALNAATAVMTVRTAIPAISKTQIENGLAKASLPGRFEVSDNIVLDGAHTVKSIQNTIKTLKSVFPDKNYHLLFACAGDKDIKDIIKLFKNNFDSITFTQPQTVRHCDAEKTFDLAKKIKLNAVLQKELSEAFSEIKSKITVKDVLLVTGSFYLVSEVKDLICRQK